MFGKIGAAIVAFLAVSAQAESGGGLFAQNCAACHGEAGNSVDGSTPTLAGQYPDYLAKQLRAFREESGGKPHRLSEVMNPIAATLAPGQIEELAAYLSAQLCAPASARPGADLAKGRKIYMEGNPAEGLPACVTCHRPTGAGIPPEFPSLAGQQPDYLEKQLAGWMEARGGPGKLMSIIAPLLQPEERRDVADYIASLR